MGLFVTAMTVPAAADKVFTGIIDGVALGGYDAVSYFTGSEPIPGKEDITSTWDGAVYRFSTPENRDMFMKSPQEFAPQYGGFCAYAAAKGALAPGDPLAWTVVDKKLYINLSPAIRKTWLQDVPGNIRKANANWPSLQ